MSIKKKVRFTENFIEEFNKKRNKRKCKSSEYLIELFKCSDWYWLIVMCELSFYIEKEKESDLINEVEMITPDEMIEDLFPDSDLRSILRKNKLI